MPTEFSNYKKTLCADYMYTRFTAFCIIRQHLVARLPLQARRDDAFLRAVRSLFPFFTILCSAAGQRAKAAAIFSLRNRFETKDCFQGMQNGVKTSVFLE